MTERLTNDERGDLRTWDNLAYSCACLSEFCEEVPCHNDRDDLYITVERILTARVQAAKADAWEEGYAAAMGRDSALAEHDRQVAAKALRDAADVLDFPLRKEWNVVYFLRDEADRIAGDS